MSDDAHRTAGTEADAGSGVLSLSEALTELISPWIDDERWSTLAGRPALIVDLPAAQDGPADGVAIEAAQRRLGELACPTIALRGRELSPVAAALCPGFDVVVESAAELARVTSAVRHRPQASLALVQLLRHNQHLDAHEGLIAESLVYSTLQAGAEYAGWRSATPVRPRRDETGPAVLCERTAGVLRLSLNRPGRHNAFSVELRDALAEALRLALGDDQIEQIVLRGEGPSFCSGGDLDEFGTSADPATAHLVRSTRNVGRMLVRLAARTRVEVHGACVGAGVELPAFASHVSARPDAYFELPEVGMGLVPGAGGTVSLPPRIGRQRTAWLALTGGRIEARTALAWGLVDELTSEPPAS